MSANSLVIFSRRSIIKSISKYYPRNITPLGSLYYNLPSCSQPSFVSKRNFSDSSSDINKIVPVDSLSSNSVDLVINNPAVSIATEALPQHANIAIQSIMNLIENVHVLTGIPYWEAIIAATIGLRILLFPVALKTIQSSARMAVMRPEMQKIQDLMSSNPNQTNDPKMQLKYQNQMKAMFVKYKVNPFRAMLWPLFQFPVFIGCFLALKDMGTYFPGFKEGGDFWFTDLSGPDTMLLLPIVNSLTFLIMIEIGGDGIQVSQMQTFRTVMRGMAVVMVPLTMSMPQGLFIYWCTNNVLSIAQTFVLKQESLRTYFDIPKPPADVNTPALKIINPMTAISQAIERERSKGTNAKAEILDEIVKAPKTTTITTPAGPPKITFVQSPKRGKKESNEK